MSAPVAALSRAAPGCVVAMRVGHQDMAHGLAFERRHQMRDMSRVGRSRIDDRDLATTHDVATGARERERDRRYWRSGGARGGTARAPPRALQRAYDRTGYPRRPRATCFPHRHRGTASSACSGGNVILRDAQPAAARGGNQGRHSEAYGEVSTASRGAPDDGCEISGAAYACRCRLARAGLDRIPRRPRRPPDSRR